LKQWRNDDGKIQSLTFSKEDIDKVMSWNSSNLEYQVAMILGIHGLLRIGELKNIKVDHITKSGDNYDIMIKRLKQRGRKSAVTFKVCHPVCVQKLDAYVPLCRTFVADKPVGSDPNTCARRLFHKLDSTGTRAITIVGKNMLPKWPKEIAALLGKPNDGAGYSGHAFRRSGASLMCEHGATADQLMQAGSWKSLTVAQGYIFTHQ